MYSVEDNRSFLLTSDVKWKFEGKTGCHLSHRLLGNDSCGSSFGIFHHFADSGRETCFSPQAPGRPSLSCFFFFFPLPSFFLWEENLLEVKQMIIKKTSPSPPECLMVRQEGPDDPVFSINVVVTSNLSPPNVPRTMTSVLPWKDLSS